MQCIVKDVMVIDACEDSLFATSLASIEDKQ